VQRVGGQVTKLGGVVEEIVEDGALAANRVGSGCGAVQVDRERVQRRADYSALDEILDRQAGELKPATVSAISGVGSGRLSAGISACWRRAVRSCSLVGRPGSPVVRTGRTVASESVMPSRVFGAARGHRMVT
jgi:hypothetical protein